MSGKPVAIAESVSFNPGSQVPASVSNNGLLLHHPERSGTRLTWLNRQGQLLREPAPTEDDLVVRLSPTTAALCSREWPRTDY